MHVLFLVIALYISNIFCDHERNNRSRCTGYSFRCSNGECIPSTSVCDGAIDCTDQSDETQLVCTDYALLCPPYAFRCAYGACVDKSTTCNGVQDCADNSDELLPKCFKSSSIVTYCKLNEFQCDSGQCIDEILICDGNVDCIDGSDESITQCINFGCPPYGFQCAYGGCIDKIEKCDGTKDCKDGSDENTEICSTNSVQEISKTTKPIINRRPAWNYGGCQLPKKPDNGDYKLADCIEGVSISKCHQMPDTIARTNTALQYTCNYGYVLPENTSRIFCRAGNWEPEPPNCLKLCEGVYSYFLKLDCYDHSSKVDCRQPMRPGTELRIDCKDIYHISDHSSFFRTTQCLTNGTWANKLYMCVPDCGIRNTINDVTPLIKGGTKAHMLEYPWHAGFYLIEGENIYYKCGGTIIHPKAVLTAAHCVYDDTTRSLRDKKTIRVTVGKYFSNWIHPDDNINEQKFGVIDINIPARYRGKDGRYEQDIAILHLDRLITLKPSIMPICMDKEYNFRLDQILNAVGNVVGSGATQTGGGISEVLRVARFPILGLPSCLVKVSHSYYITYDKFCAGLSNGTSVQKGDSGSGMTFPRFTNGLEQHFIYGIVSLKPTESEDITAFTNITVHMEWIGKVLNAIEYSLKKL